MIENKVAKSGLITIDIQELLPSFPIEEFDLKTCLYEGLVLREKDFRNFIKNHDWSKYKDKYVAIHCSVDAIIQPWAYMLLTTALTPYARKVVQGNRQYVMQYLMVDFIENHLDITPYQDSRIIIKGCSELPFFDAAVTALSRRLLPVVKSLMYGEACSSVPVYKRKNR